MGAAIRVKGATGRVRHYRVVDGFVTHDRDVAVLAPTNRARLTLVTCWPFDALMPGGSQRFVVVAEDAGAVERLAGESSVEKEKT